jgi:hypothetical protein
LAAKHGTAASCFTYNAMHAQALMATVRPLLRTYSSALVCTQGARALLRPHQHSRGRQTTAPVTATASATLHESLYKRVQLSNDWRRQRWCRHCSTRVTADTGRCLLAASVSARWASRGTSCACWLPPAQPGPGRAAHPPCRLLLWLCQAASVACAGGRGVLAARPLRPLPRCLAQPRRWHCGRCCSRGRAPRPGRPGVRRC